MTTLYLIRHAKTDWNLNNWLQGLVDTSLNTMGRNEAILAKEHFVSIDFDHIFSSPLKRALETAELITECALPIQLDLRLRERAFGSWEGKTRDAYLQAPAQDKQDVEKEELVFQRAKLFLNDLVATYSQKTVLAVSHGAFIRILLRGLLNFEIQNVHVDNLGFAKLQFQDKWHIEDTHRITIS